MGLVLASQVVPIFWVRGASIRFAPLLLLLLLPPALAGQAHGVVVLSDGSAVAGAVVEVWSPTQRLTAKLTDRDGRFSFTAQETRGAVRVLVTRVGLQAVQHPLPNGDGMVRVEMSIAPVELEGITAGPGTGFCSAPPDPAARGLWEQMRVRYSRAFDSLDVVLKLDGVEGEVSVDQVGRVDAAQLRAGTRRTSAAREGGSWDDPPTAGMVAR